MNSNYLYKLSIKNKYSMYMIEEYQGANFFAGKAL